MAGFFSAMIGSVAAASVAAPQVITKVLAFFGVSSSASTPKVYEWLPDVGYGSLISNGPVSFYQGAQDGTTISPSGNMIAYATAVSPYVVVIRVSKDGYGTAFSNPATLPTGYGRGIGWGPNSDVLAVGHSTAPYVTTYPVNSSTGFGTKYANPATAFGSSGYGLHWTPDGNELGFAGSVAPRWCVYNWSNASGFGTRQTNSYSDISIAAQAGKWNSTGTKFISGGSQSGNYGPMYLDHSVGNGFSSTVFPGTQAAGTIYSPRFNKNNNAVVAGHSNSPYIAAYPWSNSTGWGTKYSNPASLPANYTSGSTYTPSGTDVVTSVISNPNGATAWKWTDASGFGTKYSNPASAPGYTRGCEVQGYY